MKKKKQKTDVEETSKTTDPSSDKPKREDSFDPYMVSSCEHPADVAGFGSLSRPPRHNNE